MTALCMVENARVEGYKGLVHTAAAFTLGQMLNRICAQEGFGLVNIVRRQEQAGLLLNAGAKSVCMSQSENFESDLIDEIEKNEAYIAFDALGGGSLGSTILNCMEIAAMRQHPCNGPY